MGSDSTLTDGPADDDLAALLDRLRSAAESAFSGTAVFLAYAYGSRCWGTPTERSDLDVGYYVCDGPSHRLRLADELSIAGVLSDRLNIEVDLRGLGQAPLALRGRVLEQGQRIYCTDDVARVNLERDLLGEYHDYKFELEALQRVRLQAMAARAR